MSTAPWFPPQSRFIRPRALFACVLIALVFAAAALVTAPALAETLTQPDLKFSFAVPEHFDRIDPPNKAGLYSFRSTLSDDTPIIVSLDRMGGAIDRHRYKAEDLKPTAFGFPVDARMSLEEIPWRSFALDAFRVDLPKDGQHLVALYSQVPLAPEAVQVTVIAYPAHEAEARAVFRSVLGSIDGKTNWLTDEERSYKLGLVVGSVGGVGIGLGIYLALQRRRSANVGEKVRTELAGAKSLSLPELVTKLGMRDGFYNRGKVLNVLNPMVARGELLQEEPPGTTFKNRLSVLRFRLPANEDAGA
jgi:hypothetical protein